MSAHNPLSALLAAEAGFDAVWGSGFELSASHAVPDASILSPVQHLDMMRAMAAASPAPVIADIDTGFGNAINVAYLLPQRGRGRVGGGDGGQDLSQGHQPARRRTPGTGARA